MQNTTHMQIHIWVSMYTVWVCGLLQYCECGCLPGLIYQFLKCTSSFLKSIHKSCGCSKYACPQTYLFFFCWAISTCNRKNAYCVYAYVWRRSGCCICPFIPSFLSLPSSPNFCKYLSVLLWKTAPTPTPSSRLKWGGCQSPFLSQQHVHCLNLMTVTHPVVPCPGDMRPPHQLGGMTLLSGTLKPWISPLGCVSSNPPSWRQGWDSS